MSFTERSRKRIYDGPVFAIERVDLESDDGALFSREILVHSGGVGVLVVEDGDFVLIRQFRAALGYAVLEIPAGRRDVPGEPPEETARRELIEEMGMEASRIEPLAVMTPSPGYTSEILHVFLASGIVPVERQPDGAEERLAEIVRIPIAAALAMVDRGEIIDAKTVIGMAAWARRYLK